MNKRDLKLERLLRAARGETARAEMPFGFDTRVVALWKSVTTDTSKIARLFQRVALVAMVVTASAGGAAWWQLNNTDYSAESLSNAYAIADNAIELDALQ